MLTLPNVTKIQNKISNRTAEIMSFLNDNQEVFSRDLIGDLSHIHHRANSLSGIKINTVSHRGDNNYSLDFSFDWCAHTGCGHTVHEDTEHKCVKFKISEAGDIEFNIPRYEERSTLEEF